MQATPERLFDDYKHYRIFTRNYQEAQQAHKVKPLKQTNDRLVKLQRLIDFCEDHSLDPRRYLYSLFVGKHWGFAPRWDQLIPAQKKTLVKAIRRYHELKDLSRYQDRIREEITEAREQSGAVFDPRRDISQTTEELKRRYAAQYAFDRCMSEATTRTYGYHPSSTVCVRCPLQASCLHSMRLHLGYDVLALRSGTMTLDEARRLAGRYHAAPRYRSN